MCYANFKKMVSFSTRTPRGPRQKEELWKKFRTELGVAYVPTIFSRPALPGYQLTRSIKHLFISKKSFFRLSSFCTLLIFFLDEKYWGSFFATWDFFTLTQCPAAMVAACFTAALLLSASSAWFRCCCSTRSQISGSSSTAVNARLTFHFVLMIRPCSSSDGGRPVVACRIALYASIIFAKRCYRVPLKSLQA